MIDGTVGVGWRLGISGGHMIRPCRLYFHEYIFVLAVRVHTPDII